MNRDSTPEPTVPPTVSPPQVTATDSLVPTTPAPSASPTSTVQLVVVPSDLIGMTQSEAAAELTRLGLGYSFEFQDSWQPEDVVIATRPEPRQHVPVGSTVTLVISKGGIASPSPPTNATGTASPNP
jgi:beta-lactam-binding protein with PASTA domain